MAPSTGEAVEPPPEPSQVTRALQKQLTVSYSIYHMLLYNPAVPVYNVYPKELEVYVLTGSVRTVLVFASERELCACSSAEDSAPQLGCGQTQCRAARSRKARAHTAWVDSSASWERKNAGPKGHRLYDVCHAHLDGMQAEAEPWRLRTPGLVRGRAGVMELFCILPVAVVA